VQPAEGFAFFKLLVDIVALTSQSFEHI